MSHLRASESERERITALLQAMTYDSWLYSAIKEEMEKRGNWKNAARGRPDIRNISRNLSGAETD